MRLRLRYFAGVKGAELLMLWSDLKKPILVLAPMDDVTDAAFRQVVAECAPPDIYFTEFVSVDGLSSPGREALKSKLVFGSLDKPLVAQLWGLQPANYESIARELASSGNYAGIDINMGCPAKAVIKNGACSALINNRDLAGRIIQATKKGANGQVPVSVKCRIGFNAIDLSWIEFLLGQGIAALTVHARTTKEQSKVANHWEVFRPIVQLRDEIAPTTAIIANGDVLTRQQALDVASEHGVDGVMIGRGVFRDPYVFSAKSPWPSMAKAEKIGLYARHINLFLEKWGNNKNPATLKRFAKVYVNGFSGASELRSDLMTLNSAQNLLERLDEAVR